MDREDIPRELERLHALLERYESGAITHLDEDETGQLPTTAPRNGSPASKNG
jgi:hypothetical protein